MPEPCRQTVRLAGPVWYAAGRNGDPGPTQANAAKLKLPKPSLLSAASLEITRAAERAVATSRPAAGVATMTEQLSVSRPIITSAMASMLSGLAPSGAGPSEQNSTATDPRVSCSSPA